MSTTPLTGVDRPSSDLRRVAILFSGGPAPAANAVISTAAASFLKANTSVVGVRYGYSRLMEFSADRPLEKGNDYIELDERYLKRSRNSQGVLIGTARANPGKDVESPADLKDPKKTAPLKTVYEALLSLEVDALISIGGDDTLKTANKFKLFQEHLPADFPRIPVVHLPKTIDNDYEGIDFTFGYFTAVDELAFEIRNLLADAESNGSYFICETMGRSAGWLAYGAAIAGEASYCVSVEDVTGDYVKTEEFEDEVTGESGTRRVMDMDAVIDHMVRVMRSRAKDGKPYGVIVLAEGLAELLPWEFIKGVGRDDHGHIAISQINPGKIFAEQLMQRYEKKAKEKKKVTAVQLGYEVRNAPPNAFDVMLGSQLGVGAYRALAERRLNGVMVSIKGQLELVYVPFEKLVNPENLVTVVRHVDPESDFHKLVRFLESDVHE